MTIILGETGSAKSTLPEGIRALCGYDEGGGGGGHRPADHSRALAENVALLSRPLQ